MWWGRSPTRRSGERAGSRIALRIGVVAVLAALTAGCDWFMRKAVRDTLRSVISSTKMRNR